MLAVDVRNWLRPGAVLGHSCPGAGADLLDRGAGRGAAWPVDDQTEVTAAQVRDVTTRLVAAGHWREGDAAILVVFDAGYDVAGPQVTTRSSSSSRI